MSNNQDLIQTLEKTIAESHKNIRVLNAVKDTDHFIVVAITGNTVTSTASDGMNVSNAIASMAAAIRSYSEKMENSEDLSALLSIINTEVFQIAQRVQKLEDLEADEYIPEVVDAPPVDLPTPAPVRKRSAVGTNAGVNRP